MSTNISEIIDLIGVFPPLKGKTITSILEKTDQQVINALGTPPSESDYLEQCGEAPQESSYLTKITFSQVSQSLDWIVPIIFSVVLPVSLVHTFDFSGLLAANTYLPPKDGFQGIPIYEQFYILVHQIGFFMFAELGILFFYTRHRLSGKKITTSLIFAGFFTIFVLFANIRALTSDGETALIGLLLGILVPATTLGLGERLSELVRLRIEKKKEQLKHFDEDMEYWRECRAQARVEWREDLEKWSQWRQHLNTYPDYQRFQAQEVVSYYHRTKVGQEFDQWDSYVERVLAAREISRMSNIGEVDELIGFFTQGQLVNPSQKQLEKPLIQDQSNPQSPELSKLLSEPKSQQKQKELEELTNRMKLNQLHNSD